MIESDCFPQISRMTLMIAQINFCICGDLRNLREIEIENRSLRDEKQSERADSSKKNV